MLKESLGVVRTRLDTVLAELVLVRAGAHPEDPKLVAARLHDQLDTIRVELGYAQAHAEAVADSCRTLGDELAKLLVGPLPAKTARPTATADDVTEGFAPMIAFIRGVGHGMNKAAAANGHPAAAR